MKSIWKWVSTRDAATMRLLCIAAIMLNMWGMCEAKNPDVQSFGLWLGLGMYVTSIVAFTTLVIALTIQDSTES